MTALGTADHVVVKVEKIAKDQRYDSNVKNGRRIKSLDGWPNDLVESKIGNGCCPEEWVNKKRGNFATDYELENKSVNAMGFYKSYWVSHMD